MKKFFTLAIVAMIASLSFAQAPFQKAKATGRQIEKVVPSAKMQQAVEAKAVLEAKAQAAQETSGTVLRHAQRPVSGAVAKQISEPKVVSNVSINRVMPILKSKGVAEGLLKSRTNSNVAKLAPAKVVADGEYEDLEASTFSAEYYTSEGDWFCVLQVGNTPFRFDVITNDPTPLNGTYTYDQMDHSYSWAGTQNRGYEYTEASLTVVAGEDGNAVSAEAYVTLSTEEKYHITWAKPQAVEITDYVNVEFPADQVTLVDYTSDYGLFQLIGVDQTTGMEAYIAFWSDSFVGSYTMDDLYSDYTSLYVDANDYTGVTAFDVTAEVGATSATVVYKGVNGTQYTLVFNYTSAGGETGDVTVTKDANGIITSVEGGTAKYYERSSDATAYFASNGQLVIGTQSGIVKMIYDETAGKVYIKDPVCKYANGTWVEGSIEGNAIVVPTKQPVSYSSSYSATLSLRWGVIAADGSISVADEVADHFTFTIDGDVLTLQGTSAYSGAANDYYMGVFWDDDDSFSGYGDAETVLNYLANYEPVVPITPPAGVQIAGWYLNAQQVSSSTITAVKNQQVMVGVSGSDLYIQGIFASMPNAWVQGTIASNGDVVFPACQYLGSYAGSYDIYFTGIGNDNSLVPASATYDAATKTITFNGDILANASTEEVYYLAWLQDAVVTEEQKSFEEPIITNLTASLPYANTFDTDAEQAEAAIYDANEDGKTFTFAAPSSGDNKTIAARYTYSGANVGDDYVVFPGLTLEAGKSYKVSVDARAYGTSYPERIEVVAGTVAKASQFTTSVIPATDITTGVYETLTADFTPEAAGVYYFAIHAISDADMFYLYADNFSVKENNPNAPMAVTDLTVTPDENAALKAVVKYNMPTKTISGSDIEGMMMTVVKRNGEVVSIIESAAPGAAIEVTDENIDAPGTYTWSAYVQLGDAASDAASATAYVGEDVPADVENLVAVDLNNKVAVSWDAPTEGANEGILIAENLRYNVYPAAPYEFFGYIFYDIDFDNPYETGLTETQIELEIPTNEGEQAYTYVGVTASNAAGESAGVMSAYLSGAPYALPLIESFDGGNLTYWWGTDLDDDNYAADGGLGITTSGELVFNAQTEGWIELYSGKIALDGAESPRLSFSYAGEGKLVVTAYSPNKSLAPVTFVPSATAQTASIDLAELASEPWIRFTVRGEFTGACQTVVDDFVVMNVVEKDLEVAVSAPKSVVAGQTAKVAATVKNMGTADAADFTVKFYVNDVEVSSEANEAGALAFNESATFVYELETSIFDEAGDVTVKAEVVYDGDAIEASNTDETVVTVTAPTATPVASVSAEETAQGISVSWTVSENSATETTEDFESYEVGVYTESMGDWTGKDGDQGYTYGWNSSSIAWEYTGELYAFAIMNFPTVFGSATDIAATSGDQSLMFMSVTDGDGTGFACDDWFISPELPGCAQTVSFLVRPMTAQYGAETLEIMASTDGANWTVVKSASYDEEAWVEESVALAEGTKYFALHYTSNDIFALFIDDLKYTAGGGTPTGFNIYVDKTLVGTAAAEATSYTYTGAVANGEHTVSVSAVYGNAESAATSCTLNVTAIESIEAGAALEIYTVDGVRVNNAKNLKSGVYVVNGKKLVVE